MRNQILEKGRSRCDRLKGGRGVHSLYHSTSVRRTEPNRAPEPGLDNGPQLLVFARHWTIRVEKIIDGINGRGQIEVAAPFV